MDDRELDHLLAQRRDAPLPVMPAVFQQGVWREIRRRKAEVAGGRVSWFGWLVEPLFRPPMACAALALALVLGVAIGATAMAESRAAHTRLALDLDVFGSSPPLLPATSICTCHEK